ncbi:MAG: ABC-2 family transporter protein [Candidatus Krumholzibacteria bacterium]|nr:ABC-2 family transporter protein [Candidatus Krumholzibacteria bacterium]
MSEFPGKQVNTAILEPWHRTATASVGLYFHFIRLAFLKFLAYRLRYYTGVVSYTVFVSGHYYLYTALFASRVADAQGATIGGLSLSEVITYVAVSWIGRSFYFNNIARDLMRMITEGEIAMQLIKPFHVQTVMMFEAVGESGFRLIMFTLPIMVVIVPLFHIGGPPDSILYLWTFISFCLALVIYSQINFLLGCLAFNMKNIQGVLRAKMVSMDFLTGVVVPFTFFPEWFQRVVEWLPFQGISYIPVTIYLGKRPGDELYAALLLQVAWAVGLFVAGRLVWRISVRHVVVQGG